MVVTQSDRRERGSRQPGPFEATGGTCQVYLPADLRVPGLRGNRVGGMDGEKPARARPRTGHMPGWHPYPGPYRARPATRPRAAWDGRKGSARCACPDPMPPDQMLRLFDHF